MVRRILMVVFMFLLCPLLAHAADQTVLGKQLLVKNPSTPDKRKVILKANEVDDRQHDRRRSDRRAARRSASRSTAARPSSQTVQRCRRARTPRASRSGAVTRPRATSTRTRRARTARSRWPRSEDQERHVPDQGRDQRQGRRGVGGAAERRHRRLRAAHDRRRRLLQRALRRRHDHQQGGQAVQGQGSDHPGAVHTTCGNGFIDAGEQCDAPGSSCGGSALCQADCTCPCDFLDPADCLFPFPSDYLTIADPTTDTGRRVHFAVAGMPTNNSRTCRSSRATTTATTASARASTHPARTCRTSTWRMTGAAPITDIERSLDADAPVVADQRRDARSSTSSGSSSTPTRRPSRNRGDDHPPGDQPRRGHALHRRAAQHEGRRRRDHPGRRRLRRLPRQHADGRSGQGSAPRRTWRTSSRRSPPPASRATTSTWRGTSPSPASATSPSACSSCATTPSRASAPTRRLHRDERRGRGRLAASSAASPARSRSSATSTTHDVPPARFVLDANGLPIHQATPQAAPFSCIIPRAALANAGATAVPARASIYGHGLLGSQHRGQRRQRPRHGQRAQLRLLRDQVDRHGERGHRQRGRHPAGPLELPDPHRPPAAGDARTSSSSPA